MTSAVSGFRHDTRTIFRRERCKLSHKMFKVAKIMSHIRRLADTAPRRKAAFAKRRSDSSGAHQNARRTVVSVATRLEPLKR